MTRAVAMKGWRLLVVRDASRRVRRFLFETYLNPARVMSDEPSSLRLRAALAPRVRC